MNTNTLALPDLYWIIVDETLRGLESIKSQEQYMITYRQWADWAAMNGYESPLLAFNSPNMTRFFSERPVRRTTKQNQLAHLKKLVSYLALPGKDPSGYFAQYNVELTTFFKLPNTRTEPPKRNKKPLSPGDINKILTYWWKLPPSILNFRNGTFISLSLGTGMRVSEAVRIQWNDISFDDATVFIRSGKGDKDRDAAILEDTGAMKDLFFLREQMLGRVHVFPAIYKGGKLGPDRPMSPKTGQSIVNQTSDATGVEFWHHLMRFSMATEALRNGAMAVDLQEQLGHASITTLMKNYIGKISAVERHHTFKTRWKRSP